MFEAQKLITFKESTQMTNVPTSVVFGKCVNITLCVQT